jgi:hypothetical protein
MYSAIVKSYLHCKMAQLVSIGFDCGGWQGKKNAFSALVCDNGKLSWRSPKTIKIPDNPGYFPFEALLKILSLPSKPDEIVIAIDAPLGIPKDLIPFFQGEISMTKPESGIENSIAYRYTDKYIKLKSGINPLSIFDKMGINMTVAKAHVNKWRTVGFEVVVHNDSISKRKIIEVYPGTMRKCSASVKNQIGNILSMLKDESLLRDYGYYSLVPGIKKSDKLDSALCAILGMSHLVKVHPEIPKLEEIPPEYFENDSNIKEGWIYHLPFEE